MGVAHRYRVVKNPRSLGITLAEILEGKEVLLAHTHAHFMPWETVRILFEGDYYHIKGEDLELIDRTFV